jgi:simple sugar transport system permease protein
MSTAIAPEPVRSTLEVDRALAALLAAERRRSMLAAVLVPLVSIISALIIGAVLIAIEGTNPLSAYGEVVRSVLWGSNGLSYTFVAATPLMVIGLGLSIAYRAGAFTIGAEGQYLIGATAGVGWATAAWMRDLPGVVIIVTSFLVAALCGALWSSISAVLLARFGASVVITSLLLNYVAGAILQWAVRVGIRDPKGFVPQSRLIGDGALPMLGGSRTHSGFLVALAVIPIAAVVMARTRFGYRVDVIGDNPDALDANETSRTRHTLVVLLVCGALAGLAGIVEVAGVTGRVNSEFATGLGFTGIIVALLGRLRPIGVLVAAVALAALSIGFESAERLYRLPSSIVGVIEALVIVFFVAGDALAGRSRS